MIILGVPDPVAVLNNQEIIYSKWLYKEIYRFVMGHTSFHPYTVFFTAFITDVCPELEKGPQYIWVIVGR